MLMNPSNMVSFILMITSTLMALSSQNWFFIWASLEINLFSFLPIIMSSKFNYECESAIKYFMAQAIGSTFMILSSYSLLMNFFPFSKISLMILLFAVSLKLGSFPCHFWFPSTMLSMGWAQALLLSTWQKLAPLSLLTFLTFQLKSIMYTMILMNLLIGGLMGFNQNNLKSIMAYSSVAHLGWMIALMTFNKSMVMPYFIMYSSIVTPLFLEFKNNSNNLLNTPLKLTKITGHALIMYMLTILSLAGMPPMSGFTPKLMVILSIINMEFTLTMMMMIISIVSLYFYLNLTINFLIYHLTNNSKLLNYFNYWKMLLTMFLFTPLIFLAYALTYIH
uniref:NADH-ubiquinone oxidoreductase chain 2 n=1 Tax=Paracanthobdella livanowi TaxID=2905687 RepID=A0A9E8GBL1_9ANNE|nr:NADH dehydrogenase subunit 2 [Paracanthobdella livanowi]UZT67758.1 NADH dehydrogenase subunit 2 [Paracanthobdella livanowi]